MITCYSLAVDTYQELDGISVLIATNRLDNYLKGSLETSQSSLQHMKGEVLLILDGLSLREFDKFYSSSKITEKLRVLPSPKPGLVNSLNFGVRNCKFKYIARMDSDD